MSAELAMTTYWNLVVAVALLAVASTVWNWRKRKRSAHFLLWCGVLVAALVGWGLAEYYEQQAEKGIVVCEDENNCIIAMHVHSYIYGSVCGVEIELPREEGPLANVHTHKEENRLHWHERLPWDAENEKIIDDSSLHLNASFAKIGFELTDNCVTIQNGWRYCNGDSCPGSSAPGKLRVWRHYDHDTDAGDELTTWQDVVWEDEEGLKVEFG